MTNVHDQCQSPSPETTAELTTLARKLGKKRSEFYVVLLRTSSKQRSVSVVDGWAWLDGGMTKSKVETGGLGSASCLNPKGLRNSPEWLKQSLKGGTGLKDAEIAAGLVIVPQGAFSERRRLCAVGTERHNALSKNAIPDVSRIGSADIAECHAATGGIPCLQDCWKKAPADNTGIAPIALAGQQLRFADSFHCQASSATVRVQLRGLIGARDKNQASNPESRPTLVNHLACANSEQPRGRSDAPIC